MVNLAFNVLDSVTSTTSPTTNGVDLFDSFTTSIILALSLKISMSRKACFP